MAAPATGPWVSSGAVDEPGAVPLRPLGLGDLHDAAFRIIRTMGSLVLGVVLQSIGLVPVTGRLAHITMAATLGHRPSGSATTPPVPTS